MLCDFTQIPFNDNLIPNNIVYFFLVLLCNNLVAIPPSSNYVYGHSFLSQTNDN